MNENKTMENGKWATTLAYFLFTAMLLILIEVRQFAWFVFQSNSSRCLIKPIDLYHSFSVSCFPSLSFSLFDLHTHAHPHSTAFRHTITHRSVNLVWPKNCIARSESNQMNWPNKACSRDWHQMRHSMYEMSFWTECVISWLSLWLAKKKRVSGSFLFYWVFEVFFGWLFVCFSKQCRTRQLFSSTSNHLSSSPFFHCHKREQFVQN